MPRIKVLLAVALSAIFILNACSVERRLHLSGYHVQWQAKKQFANGASSYGLTNPGSEHGSEHSPIKPISKKAGDRRTKIESPTDAEYQSTKRFSLLKEEGSFSKKSLLRTESECDILIKTNGDELRVKVSEVGTNKITYKDCDNLKGPEFTILNSEVSVIKSANGTETIINESADDGSVIYFPNENSSGANDASENKTNKSFFIAMVLWFFLGLLGIHRFYIGDIGIGVLYLLTGALCGIGWLIDGVLLLVGYLKPKDGDFSDSL